MDEETRKHRSVSQYNQYNRCGYSFYLSRILGVWSRPAAWLGQGSAVHEAAEFWEKSGRTATLEETQDVFRESYAKHINEASETTPNFEYWFASGPYKADNPADPERGDIIRRYNIGLEQVEKLLAWHGNHPDQVIWIDPDGVPAIELSFDIELDGVLVRGFIDAIVKVDGELVVRDLKSGNQPGDDFQLATYAVAVAEKYGIPAPSKGDYLMAGKSGKPTYTTHPYDLTEWSRGKVSAAFQELEDNIRNERFDPKPGDACTMCDVSLSCEYRA